MKKQQQSVTRAMKEFLIVQIQLIRSQACAGRMCGGMCKIRFRE